GGERERRGLVRHLHRRAAGTRYRDDAALAIDEVEARAAARTAAGNRAPGGRAQRRAAGDREGISAAAWRGAQGGLRAGVEPVHVAIVDGRDGHGVISAAE